MPQPRPSASKAPPKPKVTGPAAGAPPPGEVAHLEILAVNKAGLFLAHPPGQDLFLPWKDVKHEQRRQLKEGRKLLVFLTTDATGQAMASTRLGDFLCDEAEGFQEGDRVDLVIEDPTDIGIRVVVNHRYWGMIHHSDLFCTPVRGDVGEGYVKALRADHKLNISLSAPGYAKVDAITQEVLDALQRHGGFLAVNDKSDPEAIYALFGISKRVFKQTLGALYKSQRILIEANGIRLLDKP